MHNQSEFKFIPIGLYYKILKSDNLSTISYQLSTIIKPWYYYSLGSVRAKYTDYLERDLQAQYYLALGECYFEKAEKDKALADAVAKEKAEKDKALADAAEAERLAKEKEKTDAIAKTKADNDKAASEQAEKDRLTKEAADAEKDRIAKEKALAEASAKEKAAAEQAEKDRLAKEKADKDKALADAAEAERLAKEKEKADAFAKAKAEAEKAAFKIEEKDRLAKEEETKALQSKYDNALAKGDSASNEKNYELAKLSYLNAASLKPKEETPGNKIKEVDAFIEAEKRYQYTNELAKKYPEGVTEEIVKEGNVKITRRIVVQGNKGDLYIKKETGFGAVYYFKNEAAITETEFVKNTEGKK